MARIFLYIIAGLIGLVVIGAIIIAAFQEEITNWALTPPEPFETYQPPPAPDYGDPAAWAARPEIADEADQVPPDSDLADGEMDAPADVFFIHPTTFLQRTAWNAAIDDQGARGRIDHYVMRYQATAFNGCCRVYAPLYRQATLAAFFAPNRADGEKALDLAYQDIRRAFHHFLEQDNQGRPFILASHSQGSRHLARLLAEEVDGTPLQDRLVAAYVVGYPLPMELFGGTFATLKPCADPAQTGCVAGWSSFAEGGDASGLQRDIGLDVGNGFNVAGDRALLCVNPLSWRMDEVEVPAEDNPGAVALNLENKPLTPLEPGLTGAQCRDGVLYVELKNTEGYNDLQMPNGNFHVYDYNLFWLSIRQNAAARVDAYLAANAP